MSAHLLTGIGIKEKPGVRNGLHTLTYNEFEMCTASTPESVK